ncbi:MAG: hypothetical protein C5B48_03705 [Candidatus Rokuibacteriota bacterium]|nr:MAG: hypothetical protein C5B48_03705 [Candidatus Rokubacteria bacterium]
MISDFDRYAAIGLGMNKTILGIPVPAGARAQMAPFLLMTRQGDALVAGMEKALKAGNQSLFTRLSSQTDAVGKKYDRVADALGLRGCGSDQTRALNRA